MPKRLGFLYCSIAVSVFGHALGAVGAPIQAQGAQYSVTPIYPPELQRPRSQPQRQKLPDRANGRLPTFDGESFTIVLPAADQTAPRENQIRALVDSILAAAGWERPASEMRRVLVSTRAADTGAVEQARRRADDDVVLRLRARDKAVRPRVADSIRADHRAMAEMARQPTTVYRFDQYFEGTPLDNTGLRVVQRSASIVITGRVFATLNIGNRVQLDSTRARELAEQHVNRTTKVAAERGGPAQLVVLAYGPGLRYAWRMDVASTEGPYRFWIDAETGQPLQIDPQFHPQDPAHTVGFNPNPPSGTRTFGPSVNNPAASLYRLRLTGAFNVDNSGADGMCTGDVTIADAGTGEANFDVAPLNGTVVNRTSAANYNCRFQELNTYSWITWMRTLFELYGSQVFPSEITATVNHNNPCGFGIDNACASGTATLMFGIGQATVSASTSCNDLFNSAIDATVIAHEFGHIGNRIQFNVGGGTLPSYLNEGLADYWADNAHGINTFGGWWAGNCAVPSQDGWMPRVAEATDVFPARFTAAGSNHGRGQIIAWALWSARSEADESGTLGIFLFDRNLVDALTTSGAGIAGGTQARTVHDSYVDLETQLATRYLTSIWIHKVLAGFARAGILLAPTDAVIDINDDFLDRNDPQGPTFTVWTGRDYGFNADLSINLGTQPCNNRYTVELASDAAFTTNFVSSGVQAGLATGAGCFGSWTVPAGNWTALRVADQLYYRATTTDAVGGTARSTLSPGNGAIGAVPAGRALVNQSGEEDCCPSATGVSALIGPLVFAAFWRRRVRRRESDAASNS